MILDILHSLMLNLRMELTADQLAELQAILRSADTSAVVATRARIVLWHAEHRPKKQIAELAGVSRPTVDLWIRRYQAEGVAGLSDRSHAAPREQIPAGIRSRILAATRTSPPAETGLSHWSSREMAAFIKRTEHVYVSHHYVAKLWRETGLKPHQIGTFKVSKDPAFADKVADVVGLYLDPPGGAVILSIDEKTQIQALDRTQPMLPITFDVTEKRTHDYRRNGTTNLFAALNVGTGEVFGECKPTRNGDDFLSFLKKAVKPYADKEIHVVLDNLSTHTTPEVESWLERIRTFIFISPPSARPGSIRSKLGSASSLASPSAAAHLATSKPSSSRYETTSHTGTPTPNHSPGLPPPMRSWPRSASSRPTSRNSLTTMRSKEGGITIH